MSHVHEHGDHAFPDYPLRNLEKLLPATDLDIRRDLELQTAVPHLLRVHLVLGNEKTNSNHLRQRRLAVHLQRHGQPRLGSQEDEYFVLDWRAWLRRRWGEDWTWLDSGFAADGHTPAHARTGAYQRGLNVDHGWGGIRQRRRGQKANQNPWLRALHFEEGVRKGFAKTDGGTPKLMLLNYISDFRLNAWLRCVAEVFIFSTGKQPFSALAPFPIISKRKWSPHFKRLRLSSFRFLWLTARLSWQPPAYGAFPN